MDTGAIIAIIATVLIIGGAVAYIIKAKKSGKRCIGCPDSATCSGNCKCCSGCGAQKSENNDSES